MYVGTRPSRMWCYNKKIKEKKEMKKGKLYSDLRFGGEFPTHEEIKALAEATAEMITDPTNTIIAVMPGKDGNPINITR